MKYRESQTDKSLRRKFQNDYKHALLRRIQLTEGFLRGLDSLNILFEYPITVISGRNGAGKSTILALACCAYHNTKNGYRLQKRKQTYYTFSDFFIQSVDEIPPDGLEVRYYIAHNNWKRSERMPEGTGIAFQTRKKRKGGKWNDYASRVKKNVVFLGIDRIVPHSERSQSRSYSRVFREEDAAGWEERVKDSVGYILGKNYDSFKRLGHSKYSLPVVQVDGQIYSGFNMGAGENALFEIFSTIYSCGKGALIVMDEVELGLHAEAQRRFMSRLKEVCAETSTQIICTTHSKEILDCLPYDARYFVEKVGGKTKITSGISSTFAFSKLSARPGVELELYVEDDVAKTLILKILPAQIRSRIQVFIIGSATAVARQLAAVNVRGEGVPMVAVFDGDQRNKEEDNMSHAANMCEKSLADARGWFLERTLYLPGDTWPEAWLIQKASEVPEQFAELVGCDVDAVSDILEYGLQAGKHKEFFEMSVQLGISEQMCLQSVCGRGFTNEVQRFLK